MIDEIKNLLDKASEILPVFGFGAVSFFGGYFFIEAVAMYMKSTLLF